MECLSKICKCGAEFHKKPSEGIPYWKTKKYCSRKCTGTLFSKERHFVPITAFKKGIVSHSKGKKFPERSGKNNPRNTSISIFCKECRKVFNVQNHRKNEAQFCSRLCSSNNNNQGKTPANEKVRRSQAYKAWRTLVFERDNYTCQECNVRGVGLHADHIKPFALYPELRLEPSNGRTLCVPCHKNTATYGRRTFSKKGENHAKTNINIKV